MSIDGVSGPITETLRLELGDIIDYGGMIGTVVEIDEHAWHDMGVKVRFTEGYEMTFTRDGKQFLRQKHSLLKVIGKKEIKTKKWHWVWKGFGGKWHISDTPLTEREASRGIYALYKVLESETEE
jgi:hypothetical protein